MTHGGDCRGAPDLAWKERCGVGSEEVLKDFGACSRREGTLIERTIYAKAWGPFSVKEDRHLV